MPERHLKTPESSYTLPPLVRRMLQGLMTGVMIGASVGITAGVVNVVSRTVFGSGWIDWALAGGSTAPTNLKMKGGR